MTIRTAAALLAQVRALEGPGAVEVDCRGVTHADAAGLQVLVALQAARAGAVVVEHVPADLAWRFRFVGLGPA